MVILIIAIVLAVYLGAWALCRISARADEYTLRKDKPPEDWM